VLFLRHDAFPAVIGRIIEDENVWVREAARKTLQRREGLTRADIHGDNRDDAILGLLSALEARHGPRARRAALNVADRLHDRFVREAYHEIVRIISPLDASLLNLERELADVTGVPDRTLLHVSRAQAHVRLITEFLDNLRAFTAETTAEFTVESLLPIIGEAVELALSQVEHPAPGIDVRQAVDESLKLEANRSGLLQAVINIIVNAVEACASQTGRGELTISAEQQADTQIRITIADNGCGMSEEALRDCVLLYSSGKPSGTGFGLPLAKKIIEIHHRGALSIESRTGVGTIATVVLPIEQVRSED
jgi:signal transduction histidine kinase